MAFHPRSPYGVSKLAAYWAVVNYREAYGLFACNGILHNHSSPRRGRDFATRKITSGIARIKLGLQDNLKMGNLSAFRDEGHAKDFVTAMHLMLQQEKPDDYVIATGTGATIREMFEHVCSLANLNFEDVYRMDERFMRPSEVPVLLGNSEKARKNLGWSPKYTWKSLLEEMYEEDLKAWSRHV
jgi:GDPmannose 4,6-dehydratase